jgi:hypothetical protein
LSGGDGVDPDAAYYQAVEEYFVSRRGEPLFLSNADWHLVRKWKTAGLPLRVVLRGIRDALDSHAHGWSRDRPVRSLAYCSHEVDAARERWERALAVQADDGLSAASVLQGFARDLERARGLGPRAAGAATAIAAELRSRAGGHDLAELTTWLAAQEQRLLQAIRKDTSEDERAAVEAEVDAALERYGDRMPTRVLKQLRSESLARRVLEAHGLPRLSLFHLEGGGGVLG